jgi:hypothetical protein
VDMDLEVLMFDKVSFKLTQLLPITGRGRVT